MKDKIPGNDPFILGVLSAVVAIVFVCGVSDYSQRVERIRLEKEIEKSHAIYIEEREYRCREASLQQGEEGI